MNCGRIFSLLLTPARKPRWETSKLWDSPDLHRSRPLSSPRFRRPSAAWLQPSGGCGEAAPGAGVALGSPSPGRDKPWGSATLGELGLTQRTNQD